MNILTISGIRDIDPYDHPIVSMRVARAMAAMSPVEVRFGGALGVDTLALHAAVGMQKDGTDWFVVYVPFRVEDQPIVAQRAIIFLADDVVELGYPKGKKWAYLRRNEKMLVGAHLLLAFSDGRQSGGTAHTMRVAREAGIPVSMQHVRSTR